MIATLRDRVEADPRQTVTPEARLGEWTRGRTRRPTAGMGLLGNTDLGQDDGLFSNDRPARASAQIQGPP